jgi:aldose 1-epimerase
MFALQKRSFTINIFGGCITEPQIQRSLQQLTKNNMKFSIGINSNEIYPVITLRNEEEKTLVEIYAFGALLNSFIINNSINIINGFASPKDSKNNISNGFKSAKLSPFVCRLADGKYAFDEHEYKIDKFYLGEEAIHGLLFNELFSVVDHGVNDDGAFVILQYNYAKQNEGFPFQYTCIVTYLLGRNNKLIIETEIINHSDTAMPLSDGWHPYFTLHAKVDELLFKINSDKMVEFNDRLVPTGNIIEYKKFQQPEIFDDTVLDNCFLLKQNNDAACILRNDKTGLELHIWPHSSYPYLQVYTPADRNSIAIENLSSAPDAFNNKMGLIILSAGETTRFKTALHVVMQS